MTKALETVLRWIPHTALCISYLSLQGCAASQQFMEKIGVLKMPYGVQSLAWHPDGKRLAVGYFWKDEVEVWDVDQKKALFRLSSVRKLGNQSGQKILQPRRQVLIVQGFLNTRRDGPKLPRVHDEPAEFIAQADKDRFVIVRDRDVQQQREIAQRPE